jgi:hypothetical protein
MLVCTVCSLWYPSDGISRIDICPDCFLQNFAGAQPSLERRDPCAREMLEAYVDSVHPPTPRQVAAMARLAEVWRLSEAEDGTP